MVSFTVKKLPKSSDITVDFTMNNSVFNILY